MKIAAQARYMGGEKAMPGDRVSNEDGQVGTVIDVRDRNNDFAYGEIAIRWDEGVIVIYHCHAEEFSLIVRAGKQALVN